MLQLFVALRTLALDVRDRVNGEEDGAAAIEYGLIAGLIAIAITAGALALGGSLDTMFGNISAYLDGLVFP